MYDFFIYIIIYNNNHGLTYPVYSKNIYIDIPGLFFDIPSEYLA